MYLIYFVDVQYDKAVLKELRRLSPLTEEMNFAMFQSTLHSIRRTVELAMGLGMYRVLLAGDFVSSALFALRCAADVHWPSRIMTHA